jgi:hypothetical protein
MSTTKNNSVSDAEVDAMVGAARAVYAAHGQQPPASRSLDGFRATIGEALRDALRWQRSLTPSGDQSAQAAFYRAAAEHFGIDLADPCCCRRCGTQVFPDTAAAHQCVSWDAVTAGGAQ